MSDLYDVEVEWEQVCREGQDLTEELARLQTDVSSLDSQVNACEPTLRYEYVKAEMMNTRKKQKTTFFFSGCNLIPVTIKHLFTLRFSFAFSVRDTHRLLRADVSEAEESLVKELESELARVRADLDSAGQEEHDLNEEDQTTAEELAQSESHVRSLRSQMDQLTQEIKQANLQSLSIAPADDLKILLEGKITRP